MATVSVISREEAQATTTRQRTPGVRRQRMNAFDEHIAPLKNDPTTAVKYHLDESDGPAQKFVLSLRSAAVRNGINVKVRKLRQQNQVHAWVHDDTVPVRRPSKPRKRPATVSA